MVLWISEELGGGGAGAGAGLGKQQKAKAQTGARALAPLMPGHPKHSTAGCKSVVVAVADARRCGGGCDGSCTTGPSPRGCRRTNASKGK